MSQLAELAIAFSKRKGGKPGYYRAYPTPTTSWQNACGALINQLELYIGGWNKAPGVLGPSASDVMRASGSRHSAASEAPIGAFHWFTLAGSKHGHVALDLDGGGTTVISATGRSVGVRLAPYLAIHSVDEYDKTSGVTYEGWTTNYGGGLPRYVEPEPVEPEPVEPEPVEPEPVEPPQLHVPDAPSLAGLLSSRPEIRKRAYYGYAIAALFISFGPDIVVAGVLADTTVPTFVAWVGLASSILLKIGTAFGFIAASNTQR